MKRQSALFVALLTSITLCVSYAQATDTQINPGANCVPLNNDEHFLMGYGGLCNTDATYDHNLYCPIMRDSVSDEPFSFVDVKVHDAHPNSDFVITAYVRNYSDLTYGYSMADSDDTGYQTLTMTTPTGVFGIFAYYYLSVIAPKRYSTSGYSYLFAYRVVEPE